MSQEKRGISMLLRSLAWQLANSTTEYADKLRQLEAAATNLKTADYRNLWQWLFKQTLFQLDLDYPLYWVIDGVDEADRPGSVIKLLSELYLTRIPLRVLLVSRKTHSISSAFQKLAKQVHMETIHTEGNIHDFRAYIDHEMDLAGDDSYREAVTAQLLDRANGNFLWIHLAVQKINSCHTKPDVENALNDLPSGMDPLYNRMALSVLSQSNPSDRSLGERILGWATCARRLLTVDELRDALGNDGVLEIHRTIADLCGGFLTVDHEGRVAMIHETARGYLTGGSEKGQPLVIDSKATNYMLFKRCIARLTDPTLRSQINRNRPPALLAYATTTWFDHFVHAWANSPEILEMVVNFLRGPHVLTWIHVAARAKELRALILASRCLTDVVAKLRRMNEEEKTDADRPSALLIEGWATDLVKIVGKFGNNLRQQPNSIYKLIPPFCPEESLIYQQFGRKEARALHVSGFSSGAWDDCLARFCMEEGVVASSVIAAGSRIAVLAVIRKTSQVIIYNSATFEEQRRITHPERVLSIQADKLGRLVSYGYLTTRIWDTATGECLRVIKNPRKRPRPHSILADEKNNTVLVCGEDRCVRSFSLDNDLEEVWSIHSQIEEETLDHTTVNFPVCSALSPDGNMIAFGYRNHPLTAWELDPPMLVGQCHVRLDATDRTIEDKTFGEVYRVAWHPFSGEIFGLTMVGLLFRWDPYEEETSATVHSGADCLTVSWDGSLIATGDAVGTIKIYATADFSVLYQLASQDPVHHLSFSSDSRQLYDVRGSYGNVWEPNTLVRLAESQDHNSDTHSETDSVSKYSLHTEHHVARIDRVVALAGQSVGPLYCYGTEDGVAILCEAGRGKVCELERLMSYMSIEQISWSEDGRLIALADLSRRIRLKSVVRSSENRDSWQVIPQFDLVIPLEKGHIRQLLFHPAGRKLLASTPTTLFSLDLESRALTESTLESALSKVTWTCHPTLPDALLGFGKTEVVVFSWNDLSQIEVHEYFPSRVSHPSPTFGLSRSFQKDTENLGRVISSIDSPLVLLELSHSGASGQIEGEYLLFDLGDMHVGTSSDGTSPGSKTIPYTLVPQHIASRIREPLAFLSRRRLVFLDVDRWICSWRLPGSGPARAQGRKGSETGTAEIEQYYFLPGDWVTSNETRLCTVTPDGTLLCPRNGDVATVQAAKLRK
jgi:WD40 repeat protein